MRYLVKVETHVLMDSTSNKQAKADAEVLLRQAVLAWRGIDAPTDDELPEFRFRATKSERYGDGDADA